MNKEQANIEAKKIFDKWSKARDEIEKKAKEDGIWKNFGLDSNNYLFKEVNEQAKAELEKLELQVDVE